MCSQKLAWFKFDKAKEMISTALKLQYLLYTRSRFEVQ